MDHRLRSLRLALRWRLVSAGIGETRRVALQGFDQRVDRPGRDLLGLLGREAAGVHQPAPDRRRPESGDDHGAAPALLGRQIGQRLAHRGDPAAVALAGVRAALAVPRGLVHEVAQQRAVGLVVRERAPSAARRSRRAAAAAFAGQGAAPATGRRPPPDRRPSRSGHRPWAARRRPARRAAAGSRSRCRCVPDSSWPPSGCARA